MYPSVLRWGDSLEIDPGVSLSSVSVWDVISLIESTQAGLTGRGEAASFRRRLKIFHFCVIKTSGQLLRDPPRGAKVTVDLLGFKCLKSPREASLAPFLGAVVKLKSFTGGLTFWEPGSCFFL